MSLGQMSARRCIRGAIRGNAKRKRRPKHSAVRDWSVQALEPHAQPPMPKTVVRFIIETAKGRNGDRTLSNLRPPIDGQEISNPLFIAIAESWNPLFMAMEFDNEARRATLWRI